MTGRPRGTAIVYAPGLGARGGAERLALQTAATLRHLGYDTWVATEPVDLRTVGAYLATDVEGIRLLALPPPRGLPVGRVARLAASRTRLADQVRILRRLSPDLFVNLHYKSELPAVGTRSIYYTLFPHHRPQQASTPAVRASARAVSALATASRGVLPWRDALGGYDEVLAISQFTAAHVLARWGRDATVLHPAGGLTTVASSHPRDRVVVSVGRLVRPAPHVPNKRHDLLIETFRSSSLESDGWSLHIVGSCRPEDLEYAEELRRLGAGHAVEVHADLGREDLEQLLTRASVYWHAQGSGEDPATHPEAHEHFGITVVEAMAAGLVPVVYATGGPAEIVEGGAGCLWRTPDELVEQTLRLGRLSRADDEELRRRAVERAAELDDAAFRTRLSEIIGGCDRSGSQSPGGPS